MTVIFKNPGSIDIRALNTFGLSSKGNSDKIGRFGTGLKYGTAVVMRNGGAMTIDTGGEKYVVGKRTDVFRGQEIITLTLNGESLPYTVDLGRDWEPWMAFRELYANALDEGGDVTRSDAPIEATGEETVISVDLSAFEAIFFSMEEHFISKDEKPMWTSNDMEVYAGRSAFIFYRGIAVMKLKEPSILRYNVLSYLDLTEDRTAKYDWQVKGRIAEALAQTHNEKIAEQASDLRNKFEASLDFSNADPSEVFVGSAVKMGVNCNPTAMALVRSRLPNDPNEATVLSTATPGGKTLKIALGLLQKCGADLSKARFVLAAGVKMWGDFDAKKGVVYINEEVFNDQNKMNRACILGYQAAVDNNFLYNTVLKLIADKEQTK